MSNETPFKITEPGYYRQANDGKAEVVSIRANRAIGWDSTGKAVGWFLDGKPGLTEPSVSRDDAPYRLIAPWTDAPILAQPAPFRISSPGRYEQRDGCVATVTEPPNRDCENWTGHDSYGADREWKADGTHAYGMTYLDLHRYIGPLDEPEPEPAPVEPVPVVDAAELKAKAWEVFIAWGCDPAESFDIAHEFLTEAARREKEPT